MHTLRAFGLALLALTLTACGTTRTQTYSGEFERPPAQSRVLIMTPDLQLSVLGVAGLAEPREDWSRTARDEMATALASRVRGLGHVTSSLDPNVAMEGRVGQLIRLHDVVGGSIIAINYANANVPTRRGNFQWTLGEGVREIRETYNADYALFVGGGGTFSSDARMALSILTLSPTAAAQTVFASLVDLRTGNIIWFNVATAAPGEDMRNAEGAARLAERVLTDAPL